MGLGGSAEPACRMGRLRPDRASARRGVVAFREVAGCARREHRPTAPGRRPAQGGHRVGWGEQGVAVRPDVDRGASGHREGHRILPGRGETLWGAGETVPAAAREPQGCGGESEPQRGATLVADLARRRHGRAGPSPPGRVLRGETDARVRVVDDVGTRYSVGVLAAADRLRPVPAVLFPVVVAVPRPDQLHRLSDSPCRRRWRGWGRPTTRPSGGNPRRTGLTGRRQSVVAGGSRIAPLDCGLTERAFIWDRRLRVDGLRLAVDPWCPFGQIGGR